MKKNKVYFGKKHLTHKEGRHNGKFVVPRMFHRYFTLRHRLARWAGVLKMACNSTHGATGDNMELTTHQYRELMLYRRRIKMTLNYGLGIKRMQALLDDITLYRKKQAQGTMFTEEMAAKGGYDNVRKLYSHDVDAVVYGYAVKVDGGPTDHAQAQPK